MNRKSIVGIIVLAVVIIGAALAWSGEKEITWTPSSLIATAVNGQMATTTVSFVSNKNLNQVAVKMSDALTPYVSVSPSSVGKVKKGENITLSLALTAASGTPPHVVAGDITLYKDNGAAKVFSTLPITLSLEPVVLPPDPGEVDKLNLEGADTNEDGVWDYVERYIALTYWDRPEVGSGLRQYAKPLQNALLEADSEEAALVRTEELGRAASCIEYRVGDLDEAIEINDTLIIQMLNTDTRSRAYLEYNQQLGGHVFPGLPLPSESLCTEPIQ